MTIKNNFPDIRPNVYNLINAGQIDPRLEFTRSTNAYYQDSTGFYVEADPQQPRFAYTVERSSGNSIEAGVLVENSATNYIPNCFTDPYDLSRYDNADPPVQQATSQSTSPFLIIATGSQFDNGTTVKAPDGTTDVSAVEVIDSAESGYCAYTVGSNTANPVKNTIPGLYVAPGETVTFSIFIRADVEDPLTTLNSIFIGTNGRYSPQSDFSFDVSRANITAVSLNYNSDSDTFSPNGFDTIPVFQIPSLNIDGKFKNSWYHISVTTTNESTDLYWIIESLRIASNNFRVSDPDGTKFYFWGPQVENQGLSTPYNYTLLNDNDWFKTDIETTVGTTRAPETLVVNAENILSNPVDQSPTILYDITTENAKSGVLLAVGTNSDQSNSFAYWQDDGFVNIQVNGVNNSSDDYDSYPKFNLSNGRTKFVGTLGTPTVPAQNQSLYFQGAVANIESTAPIISQMSFGTDGVNSGLNLPETGCQIRALYMYGATLTPNEISSLLGATSEEIGTPPGDDPNKFTIQWSTDPDFIGNKTIFIRNGNDGLQSTGDVNINWGQGGDNDFPGFTDINFTYALPGIYQTQITGSFSGFRSSQSGTKQIKPELIRKVIHWGDVLGTTVSTGTCPIQFANATNCLSYPDNQNADPNLNIDTSQCTNFQKVFFNNSSLTSVPLLDVSSATNLSEMFRQCTTLTGIEIGSPNLIELPTSQTWNGSNMFRSCKFWSNSDYSGNQLPFMDLSECTNTSSMFRGCENITAFNEVSPMNISKSTNMTNMFSDMIFLQSLPTIVVANPIDSPLTSLFSNCRSLTNTAMLQLEGWNTKDVRFMAFIYNNCTQQTQIPNLDTTSAESIQSIFNKNSNNFNITAPPNVGVSHAVSGNPCWNTSNVTNFKRSFARNTGMTWTAADVAAGKKFDMSSAEDILQMFLNCRQITAVPWDNLTNNILNNAPGSPDGIGGLFNGCINLQFTVDSNGRIKELCEADGTPIQTQNWTDCFNDCTAANTVAQVDAILKTVDDSGVADGQLGMVNLTQPTSGTIGAGYVTSLTGKGWTINWT